MPSLSWIAAEENLTAAALTVRAQTIPLDNGGELFWPNFFPREDVDSFVLRDINQLDFRPTADRREWDARGRLIPVRMPGTREIEWVPIESYYKLGEYEINRLMADVRGNEELFRGIVRNRLPQRTDDLVTANLRRIEVDAFSAWLKNQIIMKNPITNVSTTIALGLDAARYVVAAATYAAATNAYNEFVAFLENAIRKVGPLRGAGMRLATFKEIQADAPMGVAAVKLTRSQVEERIRDDLGLGSFRFYIFENTVDTFNDGGTDVSAVNIWPAGYIAAIPADGNIGRTLFAPVIRAYDVMAQAPTAGIDVRGMTVFHEAEGNGRGLTTECQVNAFPWPTERKVYVLSGA